MALAAPLCTARALSLPGADRSTPSGLISACATVAAAGLLPGLAVTSPAAGVVGSTLLGTGLAIVIPVVLGAAGQLRRDRPNGSRRAGSGHTLSYLGFLAGPPLVGALATLVSLRGALLLPVVLVATLVPLARRTLPMT